MLTVPQQHSASSPRSLVTEVQNALSILSYRQLDQVECFAEKQGHVTLSGKLQSYYLKQIAQAIALKVPGVRQVTNKICIED